MYFENVDIGIEERLEEEDGKSRLEFFFFFNDDDDGEKLTDQSLFFVGSKKGEKRTFLGRGKNGCLWAFFWAQE